ncbi:UvrD-helicase domain-containing protein [Psychroflexus sp. CAK57W]|uniref:UvrD-helicase domain-containing protein n=1 Tax=Psychroflexus curvus TaxID=2873595 RepID=UPI001CCC510B|nr:UvrD-helicase domain-containing protein [Psychroflexus curvus]MBZ9627029.1 UvrD-helicase domain-containing protein [Psychroflexus curvus]MBZ9787035.1 UvrD-helicase domain-containing protein [Psychroflexus curvus]
MPQQSNFTIYNASAGSGKTFKLAERYLSLLLSSPKNTSFQNILAITFTNKAVGEMKYRILEYLTLFSKAQPQLEEDAMFKLIKENTKLSSEQIQKKSYYILKEILDNYAAFEISTIDAFTHRIIRTFAKDLGLSMNFDIEMDTVQVLQLAVERVVEKAGSDKELTEVLIDFALEKVNDDKSGNISLDIFEASKLLLNEKDEVFVNSLNDFGLEDFKNIKAKLNEDINSTAEKLKSIGDEFMKRLDANGLEFKDFKGGWLPKFFQKLSEDHPGISFGAKWQLDIESEESYVTKNQDEDKKQLVFSMKDFIIEQFELSKKLFSNRKFFEKIRKNITQLSLLSAVNSEMELIKKEQNIMLISDFNKKISDEIKKQPAPFIFERLGEKFQHYFIDEFQDTSRLQWENLIPLTGNALASLFEGETQGTLTLVGDAKQSIYAWRGGDARQFMDLSGGKSPFPIKPGLETLGTNFRSSQAVVKFNNEFFEHVGQQLNDEKLKQLFSGNHLIQTTHKSEKGFVNLKFVDAKTNEERSEIYPQEVLNIIEKKQEQGFKLGDICILVRKKSEGVDIAEFLNQHEIPIISSETLLINSDKQVRFLLDFLNVLNDDFDEISKAKVLEILALNLSHSDEKRFKLLSQTLNKEKDVFWKAITDLGFSFDPNHFHTLPFYDAVEYLIGQFDLDKTANAYLQFFLDEIFEFTLKKEGNLSAFLNHWNVQGETKSIISTDNENAVQIMTVHKSKGLQFPVVIFPYAKQQIDDAKRSHLWVSLPEKYKLPVALITYPSKDIDHPLYSEHYLDLINNLEMENINILYVALTRAAKELFIISEDDRGKTGAVKPNTFSGLFMGYLESSQNISIEPNIDYHWGESEIPEQNIIKDEALKNKDLIFHSPSSDLDLNLVTTASKLWSEELEEALEEGNLIHSLLSKVNYKKDVESSMIHHIDDGFIEQENQDFYQSLLTSIVTHEGLSDFFTEAYQVWTEKDIYYQNKLLRPDRVNVKGSDVILIDYKTGAASNQHISQINEYADALSSLQYNVKKKLLVYITNSIEVKIV